MLVINYQRVQETNEFSIFFGVSLKVAVPGHPLSGQRGFEYAKVLPIRFLLGLAINGNIDGNHGDIVGIHGINGSRNGVGGRLPFFGPS